MIDGGKFFEKDRGKSRMESKIETETERMTVYVGKWKRVSGCLCVCVYDRESERDKLFIVGARESEIDRHV